MKIDEPKTPYHAPDSHIDDMPDFELENEGGGVCVCACVCGCVPVRVISKSY